MTGPLFHHQDHNTRSTNPSQETLTHDVFWYITYQKQGDTSQVLPQDLHIQLRWLQQLHTPRKLFCTCPPLHTLPTPNAQRTLSQTTNHNIHYLFYHRAVCHYEADGAFPHKICPTALSLATHIAQQLNAHLLPSSAVMQRPVPLQASPVGFLRTAQIARQGSLPFGKDANIATLLQLSLVEAACHPHPARDSSQPHSRLETYGIPTVELSFECSIQQLEDLKNLTDHIESSLLATGALLHTPFSRSLSLSLWPDSHRTYSLEGLPSVRHLLTQLKQVLTHPQPPSTPHPHTLCVPPPTPAQERDTKSPPLHPLSARHAPAPEPGWRWKRKWQQLGLSTHMIHALLNTGQHTLFEQIREVAPRLTFAQLGELLIDWPKALKRKGVPVQQLTPQRLLALASVTAMGRCHREALKDLLAFASLYPDRSVQTLLQRQMGIKPITPTQLRKQLPTLLQGPLPQAKDWNKRERFWMGRLMGQLRGSISGADVHDELYRAFEAQPPTPEDQVTFPPPQKKNKLKRRRKKR